MSDSKTPPTNPDETPTNILGRTTEPYSADDKPPTPPTPPTVAAPGAPLPFDPPKGYEIIEEIARGGMGIVYKARQKMPSRIVALKVMLQGAHASEVEKKRFLVEANAAAVLKHPGIVPVYEVGEHEGKYFFSMEYIEGQPLNKYVAQPLLRPGSGPPSAVPFTLNERLLLFLKICDAVTHAHIRGVIHRDLKPSNIVVDKEGNPRLLDFGLAKVAETVAGEKRSVVTMSGVLMGTFAYMSPEQTLGRPEQMDTRSDVYSLGVMLYEMLTGRMPYPVVLEDPFEIIRNIREREPQHPSTLVKALRGDLETVILKAIAKEKDRRYQSAADLARDIAHYLANEPIEARPSSAFYRLSKTVQRHKVGTGMLAILVLTFLIAFVWVNYSRRSEARQRALAEAARQDALAAADKEARQRDRAEKAAVAEAEQRKRAEDEREKAEHEGYVAKIGFAQSLINDCSFDRVREVMSGCPARYRNWEWGRLQYLCHLDLLTLKGHTSSVQSVAFSPDGKRLASGSGDKTIKVWDAGDGREVMTLRGHSDAVWSVAFSPDGKRIASGSGDNTIKVWDAGDGREVMTLKGHTAGVESVAFSPDGKRIASGSYDKTTKVWDAGDGHNTDRPLVCCEQHTPVREEGQGILRGRRTV